MLLARQWLTSVDKLKVFNGRSKNPTEEVQHVCFSRYKTHATTRYFKCFCPHCL